jgi:proteasome accessory factor A
MSEFATLMKVGVTAVVLSMIEEGYTVPNIELEDPVKAIREISRDTTLKRRVKLEDGRELTAIEIQRAYLERAYDYLASTAVDSITEDIVRKWETILNKLEEDPMQLSRQIDWVMKKDLMISYMEKKDCGWDDPRILLMDLQYHDVSRSRGLYYVLEKMDMAERVVEEEDIQLAMNEPPQTTRAKIRGDFIRFAREKNRSYTVDWTYLKLNGYWEETILCMDPFSSSDRRVEELIATAAGHRFSR